jgi:hypothetical protein
VTPFIRGFADELVKLGVHMNPTGRDVVLAESLGPLPSLVRGFRMGKETGGVGKGLLEAGKLGGGYVAGGGLGALGGLLIAKAIQASTGHDPGVGMLTATTLLPAIGGVLGGLKAERLLSGG